MNLTDQEKQRAQDKVASVFQELYGLDVDSIDKKQANAIKVSRLRVVAERGGVE